MIDIIHKECGQVAFRYTERPMKHDFIEVHKVRLLDDTVPNHGAIALCGSCGKQLELSSIEPVGGYA